LYKGNYLQKSDQIADQNGRATDQTVNTINQLTDRVFTSVYLTVGAPAAGLGEIGDFAINLSNFNYYQKTAALTWSAGTLIDNNATAFLLITAKR
jgi:hypothetical protein